MFNANQFSSIPSDALKDIGNNGQQAQGAQESDTPRQNQFNDDSELFDTGKHTQNTGSSASAASGTSAGPTDGANAGSRKKTLSQMTGGKGAKFAVNGLDFILPSLIVFIANKSGYDMNKKTFKLAADEREFIEPVMQELLDSIFVDLNNPWAQFALVFGMIYGAKIMDGAREARPVMKPVKQAATSIEHEPEDWMDEFNRERSKLIDQIRKESKRGPEWAAEKIKADGREAALLERVQKKHAKKQAA
jgi:hypothetical protein